MAVKIGSARSNENGGINGGMAGDQTGREVSTQDWYLHSKGWVLIRAKEASAREKIAANMESICANDNIGYCQDHRSSLTTQAKPYGYDASKVLTPCEVDCSEAVRNCVLFAGITVGAFNTASEAASLKATGKFEVYTEDKYCKQSEYLLRGDILVTKTKGHTVVVLTDGTKAATASAAQEKAEPAQSYDKSIAATYKTTADLNLRAGAGTGKKILTVLPKGSVVRNYGYYTLYAGKRWYYVNAVVGKTTYTGYCSSAYLQKQ